MTDFPLTIGTHTIPDLLKELEDRGIQISTYAREMAGEITPLEKQTLHLTRVTVQELGFERMPTTTELYKRISERGFDLCPPEVGLYQRLADKDQPNGWYSIGMEPISASDGDPRVFFCKRLGGGAWLGKLWADLGLQWDLGREFVLRRRKSDTLASNPSRHFDTWMLCFFWRTMKQRRRSSVPRFPASNE